MAIQIKLRTDHDIVQLPDRLPNFGGLIGKGISYVDPDFQTRITRITDASDNKNSSMLTACTGHEPMWNADETMLYLSTPGGANLVYQFVPAKAVTSRLLYKYRNPIAFSRLLANTLYELDGTVIRRHTFQRISGVWTYVKSVDVCDFAQVLPTGFKLKWTGTFNTTSDDSTFVVAFSEGVQNTAVHSCVWQKGHRVGKGYRLLNTATGMITGDWGELGEARIKTDAPVVPFAMHESSVLPNPRFAKVGIEATHRGGACQLFWEIATLELWDRKVSGHGAEGFLHMYAGGPGGGQIAEVPYEYPPTKRLIIPKDQLPAAFGQDYDGDRHYGFGKVDPTDNAIFWTSGQSDRSPFTSCWMNEIIGYHAQTGMVYRVCHTFNSGKSTKFIAANATGVASPKGRFFAFTSDMMGTLGSESGAEQGTLGVDARADVFIVRMA